MPWADVVVVKSKNYADARAQAERIAAEAVEPAAGQRPDMLVVMGGDGMAALGINACADANLQLGIVPAGTGNDIARGMGLPQDPMETAKAIATGQTKQVDLALVEGDLADGTKRRYVGSVVCSGYDAKVNFRVNNSRFWLGKFNYLWATLTEILKLRPLKYRIAIDGEEFELNALLIAVGNAGYYGGGVHINPDADPTDGLLDITIIDDKAGRLTLLKVFPQLMREQFISHPAVSFRRGREIYLDGDGLIPMADGEELGPAPLYITSMPRKLTLLCGPMAGAEVTAE